MKTLETEYLNWLAEMYRFAEFFGANENVREIILMARLGFKKLSKDPEAAPSMSNQELAEERKEIGFLTLKKTDSPVGASK